MKCRYRMLSLLLSFILLFSNIFMTVEVTGLERKTVSENDMIIDEIEEDTGNNLAIEEHTETEETSEAED